MLESGPFELKLANAQHVKNVPGRKTDACDAAWLCQLLECLLRSSFVPPREIARLRDMTRYRTKVVADPRVGRQAPFRQSPQGRRDATHRAVRSSVGSRSHQDGYLPAQYRRFCRRFGKRNENKATFALAHTLIVIIWHVLANGVEYHDLGADYFDRRNDAKSRKRYLIRELEKLGNTVTLEPAA